MKPSSISFFVVIRMSPNSPLLRCLMTSSMNCKKKRDKIVKKFINLIFFTFYFAVDVEIIIATLAIMRFLLDFAKRNKLQLSSS